MATKGQGAGFQTMISQLPVDSHLPRNLTWLLLSEGASSGSLVYSEHIHCFAVSRIGLNLLSELAPTPPSFILLTNSSASGAAPSLTASNHPLPEPRVLCSTLLADAAHWAVS